MIERKWGGMQELIHYIAIYFSNEKYRSREYMFMQGVARNKWGGGLFSAKPYNRNVNFLLRQGKKTYTLSRKLIINPWFHDIIVVPMLDRIRNTLELNTYGF